jgi:hypothetical protein
MNLREIASTKLQNSEIFDLKLSQDLVFANGANSVVLRVGIKNQEINPEDLKLISDMPIESGKFTAKDGIYAITIKPKVKSPNLKLMVIWKDQLSSPVELKTTIKPLSDTMIPLKSPSNETAWVSGLYYQRQDNLPAGQFEGFQLDNQGPNPIVSAQDSSRQFDFEFEEQARQNISMMISDAPNGTVSHTMHSYFMFFPRKYLPYAELNKKEVTVTLPTGEKMMFAESGEIIDGVFEEGPVDTGPDRFKRTYADLKYHGKGILLRANARGQMPQQGQFEATKIDMEYGIKYSADVLIINGTTGQRCRRPKIDFWPSEDVSPILFKFPSDKEFDAYLKAKCNFGIPDLGNEEKPVSEEKINDLVSDIWNKCQNTSELKSCLEQEASFIENDTSRSKVKFEIEILLLKAKEKEGTEIEGVIQKELIAIRAALLSEATWLEKQSCLEKSKTLVQSTLQFHDLKVLIRPKLEKNCVSVKEEMEQIAAREVSGFDEKLKENFDWSTISTSDKFISECQAKALTMLSSRNRYHQTPSIYLASFKSICRNVESSESYKAWLQTQGAGLEEKVFSQIMIEVEAKGEKQAQSCLVTYPVNTQLNRMRYKTQRENCLIDNWYAIEAEAVKTAQEDPLVKKVNLSLENVKTKVAMERRKLQLKIIKKYFI